MKPIADKAGGQIINLQDKNAENTQSGKNKKEFKKMRIL